MKNTLSVPSLISLQSLVVSAFSPSSTLQGFVKTLPKNQLVPNPSSAKRSHQEITRVYVATANSPITDANVIEKNEVLVSRISVCAGELCQCQGEQYEYTGGATDAAIEELQSLGLSFPVDEVGCMGACGLGTMIAIDYENGDSIMTDGLESTLLELGLQRQSASCVSAAESAKNGGPIDGNEESKSVRNVASVTNFSEEPPFEAEEILKSKKPPLLADARERMRQEAAGKVENPWMNMASYLAKKAADKMLGSG
mmetsp:Transcript_23904/g.57650  ORF Transcript_23904/g.57650 Transcript_23904/m.57650 type:complete len:255 (-) Transcript_23904:131-895(-)|eukprot:CAMPEP_0181116028 /NCGR_PEP_ID=MMETSP1071-20121207/21736_1 /TAXON_ID=35127 /ORGANISM="Thalassiosira sp., Strain NH16" /LENGTH=254 /DNA_ID=CAMNT_0023200253 /DNA_START=62 /DNA_END=826 /DNA_ORIENTATION=+